MEQLKSSFVVVLFLCLMGSCKEEVIFDSDKELKADLIEIDQYLDAHNIQAQIHDSQARYRVIDGGQGEELEEWDEVYYLFDVYLLDGTLIGSNRPENEERAEGLNFYNNSPSRAYYFPLDMQEGLTPGFIIVCLDLVKDKSKIQLFAPSYLAYGDTNNPSWKIPIPPNSPILIEFEVVKVEKKG